MLTRAALKNPVAVLMLAVAVCVLGYISLTRIPVDLFPNITLPVVIVGVVYPGAGPRDVEASITREIERAVASVPGVSYIESTSRQGIGVIRATFSWGADVNTGAADCIQRVQQIMSRLPAGTQSPFVVKLDLSNFSVLALTVSGEGLDDRELYDLAYNVIEPQIEHVPGVATASISGGAIRQINVLTDRESLAARGLSASDVVSALTQSNFLLPSGRLRVGDVDYNVFNDTQVEVVEHFGEIVVRTGRENAAPVFVRDVATVEDGAEDRTNVVRVAGKPGVALYIRKQPGANTIDVVDRVLAELPRLRNIPLGVKITPTFDQSTYIRNSIGSLVKEALIGAVLAIAVIFLFLRTFRSTVVIALSIPLSILVTFFLIYFVGGQSLNTFTLGGLALAVGRLVDDSIVVLENIFRHRSRGSSAVQAALDGTREVAMPVLASTIATIAVFFPVVFLAGIAKLLFIPLTLTIVFGLTASYFAAMAVVPPLTLRFVRADIDHSATSPRLRERILGRWRLFFEALDQGYSRILRVVLHHRAITAVLMLVAFLGSMMLFPLLGSEFFPQTDESQFSIIAKAPIGTRVEVTEQKVGLIEQAVRDALGDEHIISVLADVGVRQSGMGAIWSGNSGPHAANLRVRLVAPEKRTFTDRQAADRVREKLAGKLPGWLVLFDTGGIVQRIVNFGSEAQIDVEIAGYDLDAASALSGQVRALVDSTPGAVDVRVSREDNYPQLDVAIDRELVATLGMTTREVAQTVLTSVAGSVNIPGIFTDPVSGREYSVVVRMQDRDRASLSDLEDVPIATRNGALVALRTVAQIHSSAGPVQIDRKYQERIVHVTANVRGRSSGEVAFDIEQKLGELSLPEGFSVRLAGERAQQKDSFRDLFVALGLALMLVYMALATQFRSLREPFIVMFSVPMGLIGVVWTLYLTDTPLSVNAFMGIIMMVGIVVSNGILLVDFAGAQQAQGKSAVDAAVEAGRVRLRPILMTTLCTLLGLLPMAIGIGEGSESNVPLARAVVGGLTVSTFFTLFLIPILYTVLRRSTGHKVDLELESMP
ncbi:MAG: efflux RND transporter permease subunit [Myxococcota bacterium]|nr:efflux RND transporter permease subunit [Myxococcota bacterium]